eukprot:COSAG02_NODE_26786_length_624_cov_1.285714_1_plen_45_part_10
MVGQAERYLACWFSSTIIEICRQSVQAKNAHSLRLQSAHFRAEIH